MRTNNSNVKKTIISIYFILLVLAVALPIFIQSLRIFNGSTTLSAITFALGFAVLFFAIHFVCKFFEYDSDGTKVILTNRGLLISQYLNYRQHVVEFEKESLIAYSFKNYIVYRTLSIYIKDSRGSKRRESFNITLITKRKRRYIRQSLKKIVKKNNKASI